MGIENENINEEQKHEAGYVLFKLISVVLIVILVVLYFFISYITEQLTISQLTKSSEQAVKQMKLTRAYYVDSVVKDVKKYAPELSFSYAHQGLDGKLPLPTTTIHDLSRIFSDNTGIKFQLYSDYPFKNREDRILTPAQVEAISFMANNPEGTYVRRDMVDGEPVLRVAVTDYMTSESCVKCHNNHPDRTWEKGKWKLGDKRGIIEVVTPIGSELEQNVKMRNQILFFIFIMIGLVLVYNYIQYHKDDKEPEEDINLI